MTAIICFAITLILLILTLCVFDGKKVFKVFVTITTLLGLFSTYVLIISIDRNNTVFDRAEVQIIPIYSAKTEIYLYNTNGTYVYYTKDDATKKLSRYNIQPYQGDIFVYEDGFKELRIVKQYYKYPEWLLNGSRVVTTYQFHVPEHSVMEGFKFE